MYEKAKTLFFLLLVLFYYELTKGKGFGYISLLTIIADMCVPLSLVLSNC